MNIADRTLALVDLALRRRFAFVGLEPRLEAQRGGTGWFQRFALSKDGPQKQLNA